MPELPEVHTITTDLIKYVQGAQVIDVHVASDYLKVDNKKEFENVLKNKTIVSIQRVAKNIVMQLSTDINLLFHLAMTGRILLRKQGHPQDKWERVRFVMEKNDKRFEIRFCDMRMFGKVKLLTAKELATLINSYGPEPIQHGLSPESFLTRIQSKKTNIKNVLLDQNIISGLGNVYATDALWLAKIHPQTLTQNFDITMAKNLLSACKDILIEGISNRGISMSDYVDLLGNKGMQQNFFRVYNKDTCSDCQTKITFIQLNGRGTYFCANCQSKTSGKRLL